MPGTVPPVATSPIVSKYLGLPIWAWAGIAAGAGLTGWALFSTGIIGGGMKLDPTQQAAFLASLPAHARPYGPVMLRAAESQGVDPFAIYALGDRESLWGTAWGYKQDTGDWTPRKRPQAKAVAAPHIYKITSEGPDAQGNVTVMPADGLGWGRGLMQIDWEQQYPWVSKGLWRDPYENVKYGASYLKTLLGVFSSQNGLAPIAAGGSVNVSTSFANWINQIQKRTDLKPGVYRDPRPLTGKALQAAAIAAYNTGPSNVIRNLALGLHAEATTTGGDYTGDTMKRQADLVSRYQQTGAAMPA